MIELNSQIWHQLTHAYGTAEDIPGLLNQLAAEPGDRLGLQSEPWHSLWSALCHQGDVFTASYASVPHIIDIASKARGSIDPSFFALPADIEIARQRKRGPALEEPLEKPYLKGIAALGEAAFHHLAEPWGHDMTISVISALAVAKGHFDVGEAVGNFDGDLITLINSGRWMEC